MEPIYIIYILKLWRKFIWFNKTSLFVDKTKTASLGKTVCLIGGELNLEWFFDDISCIVYSSGVKLLVPENANLKALELRIDKKAHKLHELTLKELKADAINLD